MAVKEVGKSYKEYLQEVRARQFGWVKEEITEITEDSKVSVVKNPKKEKPKRKKKNNT